MMEDEFDFWAPTGARVTVDPLHSFVGGRHPDGPQAFHKPYVGTVVGFVNGLYQIVDDEGTMRPAQPLWLSIAE